MYHGCKKWIDKLVAVAFIVSKMLQRKLKAKKMRTMLQRWEFIKENKKVRKQESKKENKNSTKKVIKKKRKLFLFFFVEFLFSFFFFLFS